MIIFLKVISNYYNNVITLNGNSGLVTCLVFLPKCDYLVSGNETGELMLWDISNGTLINIFNHPPKIHSLVSIYYDNYANYFASSNESNVIIWNRHSLKKYKAFNCQGVISFAYNTDNDVLATGCSNSKIIIWQLHDWKRLKTITTKSAVLSLAFLPNGTLANGAKGEDKIRIWSIITGNLLQTLSGHTTDGFGDIESIIVLPNKTLASIGNCTLKVWNIQNWRLIETFNEYVKHMALLPSGNLVSCSYDKTIKIWSIDNETNQILDLHSNTLAISSDGALASVSNDNSIQIWKN